jgi:cytochrome c oxidase subunit 2
MRSRLLFILGVVLFGVVIASTRYYEIDQPLIRYFRGPGIDPATLHLRGEFVESNLGSAQEPDGSVTLRMIAQQYVFVPQCVLVPASVPVHLRITSADAVHRLTIPGTQYNIEVVPGAVRETTLDFSQPGKYTASCQEFCGPGHYAMRGDFEVVPKDDFRQLQADKRANCGGSIRSPSRIPSEVGWTEQTIATATGGDAFRGLLLSRRCEHCHGREGFSSDITTPNLAGLDRLSVWKELQDFRTGKRDSPMMQMIASPLSPKDDADLAAYYYMLPITPDPQDNRMFPSRSPAADIVDRASHLVTLGDGSRGIPPCQACHGPAGFVRGAPVLAPQNSAYILGQLEAFGSGVRSNDINLPMRSIASRLTEDEKRALADYYGAGFGALPAGSAPHH